MKNLYQHIDLWIKNENEFIYVINIIIISLGINNLGLRKDIHKMLIDLLQKNKKCESILSLFKKYEENLLSDNVFIQTNSFFNIFNELFIKDSNKIISDSLCKSDLYEIMLKPLQTSSTCFPSYNINYILIMFSKISTNIDNNTLFTIIDNMLKNKMGITNVLSQLSLSISLFSLIYDNDKLNVEKLLSIVEFCNTQFNNNNNVIVYLHFYVLLLPFKIGNLMEKIMERINQKVFVYLLNDKYSKYIINFLQLLFVYEPKLALSYFDVIHLAIKDGFHNNNKNINMNMSLLYPIIISTIEKYGNPELVKEIYDYLKADILSLKNNYTLDPILSSLTYRQYEYYVYTSIQSIKYLTNEEYAMSILYDILLPVLVHPSNDIKNYVLDSILYLFPYVPSEDQYNILYSIIPFMMCSYENLRNQVDIKNIDAKQKTLFDLYSDRVSVITKSIHADHSCSNVKELFNLISSNYSLNVIEKPNLDDRIIKAITDVNEDNWNKINEIINEKYKDIRFNPKTMEKIEYYIQKLRNQKGFKGATIVVLSQLRFLSFHNGIIAVNSITNMINEIYGSIKKLNLSTLTWDLEGFILGLTILFNINNNEILLYAKNLYNLVTTVYIFIYLYIYIYIML